MTSNQFEGKLSAYFNDRDDAKSSCSMSRISRKELLERWQEDKKKLMDDRKTKLTQERDRSPRFEDMLRNSKASFTKKSIPNHSNENKKDLPSNFFEALSRSSSNCGIKPSSSITKIESKTNSLSPLGSSLSINKNKAVYNNVHKNDHNVSKSSTYKTQIQGKENIQRGASSNYIKESKMIVKNPKISLFEQRRQEKLSRQTCFMSKTKPILETVPSLPLVNSFLACDNEILEQEVPSLATNSVPEDPLADIEVPADQKNNTFEFEGELSLTKQSRPELLELSFEKTNVDLPQKEIFYENEVQECRDLARDFCFSEVTPLKEEQHKPEEQLPKDKFNFDNDNLDDWIERFNYDEWDSNTVMAEEQDEAEEGKSLFDVHDLDAATEFGFEDDDNFLNDEFGTDKSGCDVAFTPLKQSNLSEFKMNTASPFACKNGNRSQTKQPQLNEQDVLAENQSKEVDHDFSLEEKITPYRQIKTIKSIKNVSQFDFMEEEFKEKELKRKRQDFEQDFAIKESSLETQGLKKYSTTQSKAIADNKCHEKITISNFIDSSFPESMNQMEQFGSGVVFTVIHASKSQQKKYGKSYPRSINNKFRSSRRIRARQDKENKTPQASVNKWQINVDSFKESDEYIFVKNTNLNMSWGKGKDFTVETKSISKSRKRYYE